LVAKLNTNEDPTITDDMMNLRTLLEKSADADLLREMIGFAAQRLMEFDVEGLTGAAHGARDPERWIQKTAIACFKDAIDSNRHARAPRPSCKDRPDRCRKPASSLDGLAPR
jgi:hypothetical protein